MHSLGSTPVPTCFLHGMYWLGILGHQCSPWGVYPSSCTCLMHPFCFFPIGMAASELARELQSEVYHYRSRVFAESTKGTYCTYRDAYFRFCELIDCALILVTTYLICQYVAYLAHTHKATPPYVIIWELLTYCTKSLTSQTLYKVTGRLPHYFEVSNK